MKILATIESVKVARQRQNDDGTWSPVYGIKLVSGDDVIVAESYRTKESLAKAGIVKDAVGTAQIEFKVKEGTSEKTGKDYCFQSITLRDFSLANRNISTESAQTAAGGATEQPKEEKPAEGAQVPAEPQEPKPEEGKTSDLPF
jgi:hypothetical protein